MTAYVAVVSKRSYDREILRLAVPALGALAAEPIYVLVDTAVVGHLGTPELGGLAVAGTVLTTGFFLFNFLAYGTTASVSRLVGANDQEAAAHQAVQGCWLAAVLGVLLAGAGVLLAVPAMGVMGATGEMREAGTTYLRISALGSPAVLLTLVGAGYLRGLQDTRTTFYIAAASNVANLVIEVVLIFGLGFGIGASALSTVIAQYGAAVAYVAITVGGVRRFSVSVAPALARIRALLVVGRDLFVRTGSLLAALAVATAVASRIGTVEVASHQIAFQVWSLLALVLDSIAVAGQAMVGRYLGAGSAAHAREASRRMLEWGVGVGIVVAVALAVAAPILAPVFTNDQRVVELTRQVLLVVAVMQPVNAVVFVLDGVLIGAGDLRYLALAMLASSAVFVPLAIGVLAFEHGLLVLWAALVVLMLTRLGALAARFRGDEWAVVGAAR